MGTIKGEQNPNIKLDLNDSFCTVIDKYNPQYILILCGLNLKEISKFLNHFTYK